MARVLVPLLAVGVLVALIVGRNESSSGHAERAGRPDPAAAAPVPGAPHSATASTKHQARVIRGRVMGPYGRPVRMADVSQMQPESHELEWTDEAGRFELQVPGPGRYVLQAVLEGDLAPQRKSVVVPPDGDPPEVEFLLRAAGRVYGELFLNGRPVQEGYVDLFDGEEQIAEAQTHDGFFTITDELPRDALLRLEAIAPPGGFLDPPMTVRIGDAPVDVGRLDLTPCIKLVVRLFRPDGTESRRVWHAPVEGFARAFEGDIGPFLGAGWKSGPIYRRPGPLRLVLRDASRDILIPHDFDLEAGMPEEVAVLIPPGPIRHRGRVLDERGGPVRARLRPGFEAPIIECDDGGAFEVRLPHGGLFALWLVGLYLRDHGWVDIERVRYGVLVDTTRRRSPSRFRLGGRVLVRAKGDRPYRLKREGDGEICRISSTTPRSVRAKESSKDYAVLTPLLEPGWYRWSRAVTIEGGRWRYADAPASARFQVRDDRLNVLDLRGR